MKVGAFGAVRPFVPDGVFSPSGASVPGKLFSAGGFFRAVGASVLEVSLSGWHDNESLVW